MIFYTGKKNIEVICDCGSEIEPLTLEEEKNIFAFCSILETQYKCSKCGQIFSIPTSWIRR